MKSLKFEVKESSQLLRFLIESLAGRSRTTVKSYLSNRQVFVDGALTTQFDAPLKVGAVVEISLERQKEVFKHPLLRIVHEDDDIIVINKREGLLSIATDKEPIKNAYAIISDYLKRDDPKARVFVVHRLDRETSGLMMFAKSQKIQEKLQHNWNDNILERKYFAVVEGCVENPEGAIESYLVESKAFKVYASKKQEGKLAVTHYRVLGRSKKNSLIELQLQTGRKNQIRAHLEHLGYPIIGDKKYGATTSPLGRVALHAGSLSFVHPVSGQKMDFSTAIPKVFESVIGKK